eukprot:1187120-Prorocentrum_minimum.AAC.2
MLAGASFLKGTVYEGSSAPGALRSLRTKSRAASGTWSGKGIISKLTTFWNVRYSVSPLKGGLPTNIWNSTQPSDQKSVLQASPAQDSNTAPHVHQPGDI